jgi:hypothetical protein
MCVEPKHYANLSRLLRREWLERLWTIQEVVVAKNATVVCGSHSLPWQSLEKAAQEITILGSRFLEVGCLYFTQLGHERIFRITECSRNRGLFPILQAAQANNFHRLAVHATDHRDRLFGLMGIVDDAQDIDVDYAKDCKEVYRSWVTRHIRRAGTLDVLSICADSNSRCLPSWVPT